MDSQNTDNKQQIQQGRVSRNQQDNNLLNNNSSILEQPMNNQEERSQNQNGEQPLQKIQNGDQRKDFSRVSSSPSSSSSVSPSESNEDKWDYESIKQGDQLKEKGQVGQEVNDQSKIQAQGQKSKHHDKVIRYKYCCKKCKHADRDKDKKACVCVVPRDQRRTHLGCEGCQTCGCIGCSKQDFIFRGEDPQYNPDDKKKQKVKQPTQNFQARNGCCKSCMKAFSKSGKSCICQVPENVRKTKLCTTGCKICGCTGCNPQDRKDSRSEKKVKRSRSRSERRKQKRDRKSRSKDRKKRSKSRSPQIIDTYAMNFHNIDRSIIGSMIISEYQIDPALLGFGIPQRSSSYLFGRNHQK